MNLAANGLSLKSFRHTHDPLADSLMSQNESLLHIFSLTQATQREPDVVKSFQMSFNAILLQAFEYNKLGSVRATRGIWYFSFC